MYLIPGVIGFIACCLFDINKIKWQSKKLNFLFAAGTLLLVLSTVRCIIVDNPSILPETWELRHLLYLLGLLLSGAALIYTLFFALPFSDTYVESDSIPLISSGVYAICRHPGFWLLALFYLFLWLFFAREQLLYAFVLYTFCNYLYIYVQDRYLFPQYIQSYDEYKKSVPFLLPTGKSLRNAFRK